MRKFVQMLILATSVGIVGCGSSEYESLEGKVALLNAPGFQFSGDVLELRLEGNPLQRAFGQIEPDGTFRVETLDSGKIASGVRPGVYQARIVLSDDDPQHVKLASKVIDRKFTRFETSGLKIQVPSSQVVLQIPAK